MSKESLKHTPKHPRNGTPKILMVDDKKENLIALDRLLKDVEVETYRATSGNDALALTLHHDFALALLDIQMPEMDGYELAEFLRQDKKTAHLPFIFLSAIYKDSINIFNGYEKGAFSYITKPFEPEQLLSKVRFFIDKHKQEQALTEHTKELERLNQELESFSYSVSHDLRAPLRAIDGFSNILVNNYSEKLDETGQRYLKNISDNAVKMGQLIDDILSFSRLGRQEMRESAFSVEQLFKDVYKELNLKADYPNAVFHISELPEVIGDRSLIKQVVQNLLSNAFKYSSKNEKQEISVGSQTNEDGFVEVKVCDNGAGFDMAYYDKLFGVFQRLHRDNEFKGNGVGLALSKRIIERHGGEIWAKSELGKGANFFFTLKKSDK